MLAIIIPYYKLTFFEETLESLANQTDKRFKVFIGDDNSQESPVELLKKYNGKIDFVYHRFDQNLGGISLTRQWDRCLALSENEEWMMILGDDDFLGLTVVESFYKNYTEFNQRSNVIRFATKVVLETANTISKTYVHPVWETANDSFIRILNGTTRSSLSEYVFSKTIYKKQGFIDYPLAWCSDTKAWLDFSDGKPIYTINESIVYFRISNINISGQHENIFLKKDVNILFLKDIVINNIKLFKKEQRLELLLGYEITIKKARKLTLSDWSLILNLYLKNFQLIPFVKYIRRFFISIFRI